MGLDQTTAAQAVGPVAPPVETSAVAAQLGHRSQQLLNVLGTALSIVGVVTAAPFVAAGAVVAGLAAGLDPIVFGVIRASEPVPGEPAAWYILAQWTWPDASGPDSSRADPAHHRRGVVSAETRSSAQSGRHLGGDAERGSRRRG